MATCMTKMRYMNSMVFLSRRLVSSHVLLNKDLQCYHTLSRYEQCPCMEMLDVNPTRRFSMTKIFLQNDLKSSSENDQLKDNTSHKDKKQSGQVAKLAKVFAEYGTIGVVFHTTISLTSLGLSYLVVSSGVDVVAIMQKLNVINEVTTEAKLAGGASTFVIAYALHKVFMPVRVFITVSCTPLIVKKLRKLGLLKKQPNTPNASGNK